MSWDFAPVRTEQDEQRLDDAVQALNHLLRIVPKSQWAAPDREYIERWLPLAREHVRGQFRREIQHDVGNYQQLFAAIDIADAYNMLVSDEMIPDLRRVETIDDLQNIIKQLDGIDSIAFDTARNAERLRALIEDSLQLWEQYFAELAVSESRTSAVQQAKAELRDIYMMLAKLRAFLVFYNKTMERATRMYEKVSRIVTIEQLRQGLSPISRDAGGDIFDPQPTDTAPKKLVETRQQSGTLSQVMGRSQ